MAFSVNDSGTWKTVKKLSVNDGVWKAVKSGWINKAGVWTKFYSGTTTVNVTAQNNINLRTLYVNQTGDSSSDAASVIFNINGNIGSTSTATAAMVTGAWPAGSEIVVNVATGVYVVGAGGSREVAGGSAISLGYNVTIVNNGVVGGGGGGGGTMRYFPPGRTVYYAYGGSGAGLVNGALYGATGGTSFSAQCGFGNALGYGGGGGGLGSAGGGTSYNGTNGCNVAGIYITQYPQGAGGKAIALNGYVATTTGNATLGAVS